MLCYCLSCNPSLCFFLGTHGSWCWWQWSQDLCLRVWHWQGPLGWKATTRAALVGNWCLCCERFLDGLRWSETTLVFWISPVQYSCMYFSADVIIVVISCMGETAETLRKLWQSNICGSQQSPVLNILHLVNRIGLLVVLLSFCFSQEDWKCTVE